MRNWLSRSACIGLVTMAAIAGAGIPLGAADGAASVHPSPPPPPVTRQVQIDGRFVTVSLSVLRTIPGAPLPDGNRPTVTGSVNLSIQDGAPLPEGLRATHVRFERSRGNNRFFNAKLSDAATTSDEFELDIKGYRVDLSSKAPNAQNLNATVRLVLGDKVIRVPMGSVPVHTEPLP